MDDRKILTFEEAEAMLPDGDVIHTYRQAAFMLFGADVGRAKIIEAFKKYPPELSGDTATATNHGIVYEDELGYCFVATKKLEPSNV
jgi:hypothetical protein